jgi:hypothetical protein
MTFLWRKKSSYKHALTAIGALVLHEDLWGGSQLLLPNHLLGPHLTTFPRFLCSLLWPCDWVLVNGILTRFDLHFLAKAFNEWVCPHSSLLCLSSLLRCRLGCMLVQLLLCRHKTGRSWITGSHVEESWPLVRITLPSLFLKEGWLSIVFETLNILDFIITFQYIPH